LLKIFFMLISDFETIYKIYVECLIFTNFISHLENLSNILRPHFKFLAFYCPPYIS